MTSFKDISNNIYNNNKNVFSFNKLFDNDLMASLSSMLFRIFVIIYIIYVVFTPFKYASLVFLTNWGFMVLIVFNIIGIFSNFLYLLRICNYSVAPLCPSVSGVFVVLFQLGIVYQTGIVALYWSVVWPNVVIPEGTTYGTAVFKGLLGHGVGLVFMLVEMCATSIPFHSKHAVFSFLLGCIYLFVSFIVTRIRGYPIYSVLTYNDYKSAVLVALALTLTILFHLLYTSIRVYIFKVTANKNILEDTHTHTHTHNETHTRKPFGTFLPTFHLL
eukprot:GHVR01007863.1.p1 GENE.GHVR01007863.1~~GHVR01007863.1.p1  ORF type:complete len:273 (-),score=41.26 GHVR01007863.1:169-987(-)